jgi:hypothetical protein
MKIKHIVPKFPIHAEAAFRVAGAERENARRMHQAEPYTIYR